MTFCEGYDSSYGMWFKMHVENRLSPLLFPQSFSSLNPIYTYPLIKWAHGVVFYFYIWHYNDVIMSMMASQITSLTIVYSNVYSGTEEWKHQSSASLAFVWGIHRWPANSLPKRPVMRKMFPFNDFIMVLSKVHVDDVTYHPISFMVVPRALGQWQDCLDISRVNLKDMGKVKSSGAKSQSNKVLTVCICGMLNPSRPFAYGLPWHRTFHIIPSMPHVQHNTVLSPFMIIGLIYIEAVECHWLFTLHPNSDVPRYLAVCIQPENIVTLQFTCNVHYWNLSTISWMWNYQCQNGYCIIYMYGALSIWLNVATSKCRSNIL